MDGHVLANPIVTTDAPAPARRAAHHDVYRKLVGEAGWRRFLATASRDGFARD